jgi:two-component system LytT family sensor kinase
MRSWTRPRRIEWLSYLTMMPFLSFLLNNLLFRGRVYTDADVWIFSFPLVCLQGLVSWYLHITVMHWLRYRFPRISQTRLRLSLLAVAHLFLTGLTFTLLFTCYDATHFLGYVLEPKQLQVSLFIAVALTMIATTLWEADYTFKQLKEQKAKKEELHQLTLQQEFETLKSQVNPHFLFNCFNTLSSLISEDRKQAEVFLDELSKVYRYLLRNNQDGLSTLQTEVRFIQSYYRLLQTRHGSAVEVKFEIDRKYEQYLLPSLTLQLLVENAVKHNVLSRNKPLIIDIFTTAGNKLVVNNNLQRRQVQKFSNKIGLTNIEYKYSLLGQSGFHVLEDEKNFCVVLPLIWSKAVDQSFIHQTATN